MGKPNPDQQVEEQIQWMEQMFPPTRFPRPRPKLVVCPRTPEQEAEKVRLESTLERQKAEALALGQSWGTLRNDMAATLYELHRQPSLWGEHQTWERYCETRWGMSKRWANILITKHKLSVQLEKEKPQTGIRIPATYRETAILASSGLTTAEQVKVLDAARAAPGKSKLKALRVEVKRLEAKSAAPKPVAQAATRVSMDDVDIPALAEPFAELRRTVDGLSRELSALAKTDVGRWLRFSSHDPSSGIVGKAAEAIKTLRGIIRYATPFAPCSCKTPKACKACHGLGWVTEGVLA